MTLIEIISQLKSCGYRCEAGPLEWDVAFIELMKMVEFTPPAGNFRMKPFCVEAWQNTDDDVPWPKWVEEADKGRKPGGIILVQTIDGLTEVNLGDWIIRGAYGHVMVCDCSVFNFIYEPIAEQ